MKRSHLMLVRVQFDKPIAAANARAEFRDNVHGEFYTSYAFSVPGTKYPEKFIIKGVKAPPQA